jgi:hypothetical protein
VRSFVATLAVISTLILTTRAVANVPSASTTITISARVDKFAEWADNAPIVIESDWPAINKVGQSRTISKALTLYTNTDAVITAQPGQNQGILTLGSETLHTAYRLTGKLANPDPAFKTAGPNPGEFFNSANAYRITHEHGVGAYPLKLDVQASNPSDTASEPGLYTCTIILTAEW